MKARIRKTGEIVEVYHKPQHGQQTVIYKEAVFVNGRMFTENELEFILEESHWQDVREHAAIAAMQAILSNPNCKIRSESIDVIPKNAVLFADALIEQLKKKER